MFRDESLVQPHISEKFILNLEEKYENNIYPLMLTVRRRKSRFIRKYIKRLALKLYFNQMAFSLILTKFNFYYNLSFFKKMNNQSRTFRKVLFLNYKRNKFYPSIQNTSNFIYTTSSLGIFSKFFKKGKSFIKNKINFLVTAGFLRKILLFSDIRNLILMVKRTPIYLTETLTAINSPVIVNYKHPFSSENVNEMRLKSFFYFYYFIFFHTKPYGYMKGRKRGRIKRKITKRIVKINNLTD